MNLRQFFTGKVIGTVLLFGVVALVAFYTGVPHEPQRSTIEDYKDAGYLIEGQLIKLKDGIAEMPGPSGSASKTVTKYLGNDLAVDLNGDGREDVVFLLTQETGGSGIFYYVVAAVHTENGYRGSGAFLLGDRIAPVNIEKGTGKIIAVNYMDRAPGEPFTAEPSVPKKVLLLLDTGHMQFGEVVQDFEGEADPSRMSLGMKAWSWISALYNDGREITPNKPGVFTLTFGKDGRFSATTDCNQMGGSYAVQADKITFSQIFSTKKYCEGSQERDFATLLENTEGHHFTSRGELIFDLKFDSGSVVFK